MLSASVDIRVRYEETDKMGVVYHANYFTWFEIARIELLDQLGFPYKQLEKDDYFLPVLSCEASFHSPAFFDDRLQVQVEIKKIPTVRIFAEYTVRRNTDQIAAGCTEHAFVSREGRVLRPPPEFLKSVREKFEI
mgnify:CR=1 FL=1